MEEIARILRQGGVGVLATDTLYGVVGRALDERVVERIYELKSRRPEKPFIILIADFAGLEHFGIKLTEEEKRRLGEFWPGPVSVILPCADDRFAYLHRGTKSLAFRLPDKPELRELLRETGPLVAPSANPEGQPPATSIEEAKRYFADGVDFYLQGETGTRPSRLIRLLDGDIEILRG